MGHALYTVVENLVFSDSARFVADVLSPYLRGDEILCMYMGNDGAFNMKKFDAVLYDAYHTVWAPVTATYRYTQISSKYKI